MVVLYLWCTLVYALAVLIEEKGRHFEAISVKEIEYEIVT